MHQHKPPTTLSKTGSPATRARKYPALSSTDSRSASACCCSARSLLEVSGGARVGVESWGGEGARGGGARGGAGGELTVQRLGGEE